MEEAKQEVVGLAQQLEVVSTALAEFDTISKGFAELRQKHGNVVFDIKTAKGLTAAKAARTEIREPRFKVEHVRIEAKRKILSLGKKLDADAERLTAMIREIEDPIDAQITAEEDRKEQERLAKIEAENRRVAEIQARINNDIRATVTMAAGRTSYEIAAIISELEKLTIDDTFEEFQSVAEEARDAALGRLRQMHAAAVAQEAEQARIRAEREELARLREAEQRRQAEELARVQEAERVARQKREADERRLAKIRRDIATVRGGYTLSAGASPDDILEQRHIYAAIQVDEGCFGELLSEAQEAHASGLRAIDEAYNTALRRLEQEAEARRLAAERAELDRLEAERRREREAEELRLAEQRAELERIEASRRAAREAEEARLAEERAAFERRQEAERKEREAAEAARAEQARIAAITCPTLDEVVSVLAVHYGVPNEKVLKWLASMKFKRTRVAA
jgi:colicin import membrane protein